ncbi:MAG: hypothetical protein LBP65_01725 [Puniceicoccales bacterium]|nr:hypothetical protein [Puniceicoccales bacterium]
MAITSVQLAKGWVKILDQLLKFLQTPCGMATSWEMQDLLVYLLLRDHLLRPPAEIPPPIAIGKDEEQAAYALGLQLLQKKDFTSALQLFSMLHLLANDRISYEIAIAVALFSAKNFYDAACHYLAAYLSRPTQPELALWAVWSLMHAGQFEAAASLLRATLVLCQSSQWRSSDPKIVAVARQLLEVIAKRLAGAKAQQNGWKHFWGRFFKKERQGGKCRAARKILCAGGRMAGDGTAAVKKILVEGSAVLHRAAVAKTNS